MAVIKELEPNRLADLDQVLAGIPDGQEVELRFLSIKAIPQAELEIFQDKLISAGFQLTRPVTTTDSTPATTTVRFLKGSLAPPAAEGSNSFQVGIIPIAGALIAALPVILTTGLISLGVFKVESLSQNLLPVIAVAGGLLFLITVAQGKAKAR